MGQPLMLLFDNAERLRREGNVDAETTVWTYKRAETGAKTTNENEG